ncbi:MAG: transposase [Terriglobales bacterium]
MPLHLKRFHQSKQSHFITCSCYHRQPLFDRPARRDIFLASLERVRQAYGMRVYGYVVMPEHIHLLVSEPDRETLATAMQALKVSVVKLVLFEGERFWLKRYYDHNIRSCAKFVEKLRYINRNPVRRGLVERAEDWKWSSFRHYALREVGPVEIESEWTARRRELQQLRNPP